MTVKIAQVTFDCADPFIVATFWRHATGWEDFPGEPNVEGDEFCWLQHPVNRGTALYFQRVPEDKVVKNRLHLDVAPESGTRDEEVDRLLGHGASVLADHRKSDGSGWVTMADPEGNEFCVERNAAEVEGAAQAVTAEASAP